MKIKTINEKQYIILEENEEVFLTTPNNSKSIKIKNKENALTISGTSLLNRSAGKEIFKKVYVSPEISSESIIEKCDKWIEMYKQVHDIFRKLVLTDKYRKQDIVMKLSFSSFFSNSKDNKRGKSINLDLLQNGVIIQEGVTISVDDANEEVYKYLVANVLAYYLAQNYADTQIDYQSLEWNYVLYSNDQVWQGNAYPMNANLSLLYDSVDLARIVTSLIAIHNLGESADQVISNLRNRISNQKISDITDISIDYSIRQYEQMSSNLKNKKELKLKT